MMAICRQACPYNTLNGCKVKEYGGVCQLTNTVQPITEYRMTNADRIRSMTNEELVVFLDGFSSQCIECAEYEKNESCPIYKEGHYCRPQEIMEWLQQPAEEDDNGTD